MLSQLSEGNTVMVLQDNLLLPPEESQVGPEEEEGDPSAAQPGPKRGQGRGRRAKGRRPGAAAAASKNKGDTQAKTSHLKHKRTA